jgi:hypothetical protein
MREYDLVLCAPSPSAAKVAVTIAAALTKQGFRVLRLGDPAESSRGGATDQERDEAPDFVVLWDAESLAHDTTAVARALLTERNVVVVALDPSVRPAAVSLPSSLEGLRKRPVVPFDGDKERESVARLAHRLSSDSLVDERRLMRRGKGIFAAAAIFCLAGVALQVVPSIVRAWKRPRLPPPVAPFTLYWNAYAERPAGDPASWTEVPFADGTALAPGDRVRIHFSPSADGHAYVVTRDSRGEVQVLFPTDVVNGASKVRAGQVYSAPMGEEWLTIDGQSMPEAVYVIGSYDALQNLEELVEEPTASAFERRQLVSDTLGGLLDGRHAALPARVWTARLQTINPGIAPRPAPPPVPFLSMTGTSIARPLNVQRGWVAAAVELRLGAGLLGR